MVVTQPVGASRNKRASSAARAATLAPYVDSIDLDSLRVEVVRNSTAKCDVVQPCGIHFAVTQASAVTLKDVPCGIRVEFSHRVNQSPDSLRQRHCLPSQLKLGGRLLEVVQPCAFELMGANARSVKFDVSEPCIMRLAVVQPCGIRLEVVQPCGIDPTDASNSLTV
jgi:hypothetical protein